MSWKAYDGYGFPFRETLVNISCACVNTRGTIEVQLRPDWWEHLCHELGSTRPVTLDVSEDRAAFVTFVASRRFRVFAVPDMGNDDFRYRVVEK